MSETQATPAMALGGAACDGLISIRETAPQAMIALRGDLASIEIKNAATGVTGLDMPGPRGANWVGDRAILWMSPDELLILCPYDEADSALAGMAGCLDGRHALVTDMSDARGSFDLRGAGLRDVLAKLTPADMSRTGLPVGELRRSRLAQTPAAFWLKSETSAQIICFRSVAQYVFDLLKTAAQPGSAVAFFDR